MAEEVADDADPDAVVSPLLGLLCGELLLPVAAKESILVVRKSTFCWNNDQLLQKERKERMNELL